MAGQGGGAGSKHADQLKSSPSLIIAWDLLSLLMEEQYEDDDDMEVRSEGSAGSEMMSDADDEVTGQEAIARPPRQRLVKE